MGFAQPVEKEEKTMPEILHILWHAFKHTLPDTAKIIPFLFLTYLLMEFLEHKAGGAAQRWLKGSGKIGSGFKEHSVVMSV